MSKQNRKVTLIQGNGFPMIRRKAYPNDPCRCGSGKKTKFCCGTNTNYLYSKLTDSQTRSIEEEKKKQLSDEIPII